MYVITIADYYTAINTIKSSLINMDFTIECLDEFTQLDHYTFVAPLHSEYAQAVHYILESLDSDQFGLTCRIDRNYSEPFGGLTLLDVYIDETN